MIAVQDVADLIQRQFPANPAAPALDESTRLEDLGLTSLQISELVFTLEEQHDLEFDTAKAAGVRTLGDVVALANGSSLTAPDVGASDPAPDRSIL